MENTRRISRPPVDLFFKKKINKRNRHKATHLFCLIFPTCIIQKGIKGSKNKKKKTDILFFLRLFVEDFFFSKCYCWNKKRETWARRRRSVKAQERGFSRRGGKLLTSITFLYFYLSKANRPLCLFFFFYQSFWLFLLLLFFFFFFKRKKKHGDYHWIFISWDFFGGYFFILNIQRLIEYAQSNLI